MEQPRIRERFSVMNNAYRAYSFSYFLDSMQRLGLDQIDLWGGYQHFDPFSAGPSYLRAFREELSARQMKLICDTPEFWVARLTSQAPTQKSVPARWRIAAKISSLRRSWKCP